MEIPLFPLHAVLAPGGPLPLHIFEPRYRALVADCLAAGTPFGVVCISAGREVGAGSVSFSAIGTLAEIREVTRFPDGRYDIMTMGTTRFQVERVEGSPTPYLVGIGDVLPELLGDPARVVRLAARVRSRFVRYLKLLGLDDEGEIEALIDPVALGHIVSGLVQVDLPRRQQLLEASTTEERLADLDTLLARETALLSSSLAPHALDPRLLALRRN
jgi:Lon protease-like protein